MECLPAELVEQICLYLNCKEIILFSRTSKRFLALKSVLNIKKLEGFPREEKRCVVHTIHEDIISSDTQDDDKNSIILNYIYDTNMDVIRGDLVIFNCEYRNGVDVKNIYKCEIGIFDGIGLQKLGYNKYTDSGILPPEFHVIEDNVPIQYWTKTLLYKSIFDDHNIYFDHNFVKDQCVNNIVYETMDIFNCSDIYGIYTWFIYNNTKYYIIYDYYDYEYIECDINTYNYDLIGEQTRLDQINLFKNKLLVNNCEFYVHEEFGIIKNYGNILFVLPY